MAWRRARSLDVLEAEIQAVHPGTTVWDLGDQDHRERWSDHNPNAAGVVCAIDVLGNAGLSLARFADTVVRTDPPALKYVIYNRRIWHPGYGWSTYRGSNPHTSHVHVSVGRGPDGRSTGAYDDRSPWGIREDDMPLSDQDKATVRRLWTWGAHDAFHVMLTNHEYEDVDPKVAASLRSKMTDVFTPMMKAVVAPLEQRLDQLAATPPGSVTISDEQLERVLRRIVRSVPEGG